MQVWGEWTKYHTCFKCHKKYWREIYNRATTVIVKSHIKLYLPAVLVGQDDDFPILFIRFTVSGRGIEGVTDGVSSSVGGFSTRRKFKNIYHGIFQIFKTYLTNY